MAQKRMFSVQVTDTDKFLDMSASAQALYFHLGMHGDDDGFVSSPRKIARSSGCNDDDLRLLAAKGYIIPFEIGIVVITDWKINNTLKNDRYRPTIFTEERGALITDNAGRWAIGANMEPQRNHIGTNMEPQHSLTKQNETKDMADKSPHPRFIPPTIGEIKDYCTERRNDVDAAHFHDFYSANGWKQGRGKPIVNWKAAVRTWERRKNGEGQEAEPPVRTFDPETGIWR